MLPPHLRRKLSKLNTERASEPTPGVTTPAPADYDGLPISLEDVLPGRVHEHESGRLYICERGIDRFYPSGCDRIVSSMQETRRYGYEPEDVLFLDIETCGLANCPLFLIGVMSVKDGGIVIEQFFARDYSEESSLLAYVAGLMPDYGMLITFNGKTFDVPYMRDRMVLYRIGCGFGQEHLDLLQVARRLWSGKLPNCKLQTLEEYICGRRRVGDTPGHLIPHLYHDFVRMGNAGPLDGIFHHNALDLITMAELLPAVRP